MSAVFASAIAFARRGHPVLPLTWPMLVNDRRRCSCKKAVDCTAPAKHPLGRLVSNGLLDATTDEVTIRKWFISEPAANFGVRTDQLIVLDADPRHGGDETLAALEREHELPHTWRVLTGGGGEHVIFKCPDGVTVNSSNADANPVLGVGIDVRARNGYIVAVPSRHVSGRSYAWSVDHHPADTPLAEAPPWLVEKLATASPRGNVKGQDGAAWAAQKAGTITQYRDMAIAQVAGSCCARCPSTPASSPLWCTIGTPATATRPCPSRK